VEERAILATYILDSYKNLIYLQILIYMRAPARIIIKRKGFDFILEFGVKGGKNGGNSINIYLYRSAWRI
jgi:hypothetical protein